MAGDDDRPKKSWREIDSMRDKSAQRREGGGGGSRSDERLQSSQAYRSYKTQLNKLFDGGGLPDALKQKLEESGVGSDSKRKKELVQALLDARLPKGLRAALEQHRAAFGFPEDEEVLAKLLDLEDQAIVLEAMATIDKLHGEGRLKRAGSLKGRVATAQMTLDTAAVRAAAQALLAKL